MEADEEREEGGRAWCESELLLVVPLPLARSRPCDDFTTASHFSRLSFRPPARRTCEESASPRRTPRRTPSVPASTTGVPHPIKRLYDPSATRGSPARRGRGSGKKRDRGKKKSSSGLEGEKNVFVDVVFFSSLVFIRGARAHNARLELFHPVALSSSVADSSSPSRLPASGCPSLSVILHKSLLHERICGNGIDPAAPADRTIFDEVKNVDVVIRARFLCWERDVRRSVA